MNMAKRLNDATGVKMSDVGVQERRNVYRSLTPEELQELSEWMEHLNTNGNPDEVRPIPECYKGTIVCMTLKNMGIEGDDLRPWNIPQPVIDFYADVWLAHQKSALRKLGQAADRVCTEMHAMGDRVFGKIDRKGGNA